MGVTWNRKLAEAPGRSPGEKWHRMWKMHRGTATDGLRCLLELGPTGLDDASPNVRVGEVGWINLNDSVGFASVSWIGKD